MSEIEKMTLESESLIDDLDYRLHPNTSHIHPYMYG